MKNQNITTGHVSWSPDYDSSKPAQRLKRGGGCGPVSCSADAERQGQDDGEQRSAEGCAVPAGEAGSLAANQYMPRWGEWKLSEEGEDVRRSLDECVMLGSHAGLNEGLLLAFIAGYRAHADSQPDSEARDERSGRRNAANPPARNQPTEQ